GGAYGHARAPPSAPVFALHVIPDSTPIGAPSASVPTQRTTWSGRASPVRGSKSSSLAAPTRSIDWPEVSAPSASRILAGPTSRRGPSSRRATRDASAPPVGGESPSALTA